ncbi:hypothetical protein RFI_17971 [Reticulomyxa filosa]|uniref:Uncharacterized protein n=1 Tax=Reticulomyxa filosa TaxID=46433 RepID=X6MYY9_RETFI|nr:hypothetical protein RFI_17971 [Reticulomyxa filosa]|eukprot:ETO19260.1 hypothetical protein RFI_17971 [Reticulomyxa filosa]
MILEGLCFSLFFLIDKFNPLIALDGNSQEICYGYLRNKISTICGQWFVAQDVCDKKKIFVSPKKSKTKKTLRLCIEKGFEGMNKFRVILIQRNKLQWIIDHLEELETNKYKLAGNNAQNYQIRWNTILEIAKSHRIDPTGGIQFQSLELAVPYFYSQTQKKLRRKHRAKIEKSY